MKTAPISPPVASSGVIARQAKASSATTSTAAALQEAIETRTQTATEARGGDHQAQRLLQKQQAAANNQPAGKLNTSGPGQIVNTKA